MCCEDIQIGRKTTSNRRDYPYGITSSLLLSGAKDRTAILVGTPSNDAIWLSWGPTAAVGSGIRLTQSSPPLILTLKDHGDMVRQPITVINEVAAGSVHVITTHLKGMCGEAE